MPTHTVGVADTTFNGTTDGVVVGDIIYVTSSAGRDWLTFEAVVGSAASPVTIVNSGGKVVFDGTSGSRMYCVQFDECSHIIFRGDGHADEWGFKCIGYTNAGIWGHDETEHIEICNVEIGAGKAGSGTGAGIRFGTKEDESEEGFVVDEVYIHHCYVHDVITEGMYIGKHSDAAGEPQRQIDDLIVEYCIFEDCAWGGCPQIRNSINVQCQRNWIKDCGVDVDEGWAGGGINIGASDADPMNGDWRYNRVEGCERGIHQLQVDDEILIHHNLIIDCGDTGSLNDPQGGYKPQNGVDAGFKFYHNTIVDCGVASGGYGIETKGGDSNGEVENCVVVGSDTDIDSDWTLDNNETGSKAAQYFRSGDIWYHLTGSSPDQTCGWVPWV